MSIAGLSLNVVAVGTLIAILGLAACITRFNLKQRAAFWRSRFFLVELATELDGQTVERIVKLAPYFQAEANDGGAVRRSRRSSIS